jgi:hypothetical protein
MEWMACGGVVMGCSVPLQSRQLAAQESEGIRRNMALETAIVSRVVVLGGSRSSVQSVR